MNPAALLGLAAVGLGLFFLSGKNSGGGDGGGGGGGGGGEPPHVDPLPHPDPTADCADTVNAIDQAEQAVLDALNEDPPNPATVCAAYATYHAAVTAAQSSPCKDEIPATNIPDEVAQQCTAPSQCQSLLMAVMHDAAVLAELFKKDPTAQGDLCNAKKQLDASIAAATAKGCTVTIPAEVPQFDCGGAPYVPPGTDCNAEYAAFHAAEVAAMAAAKGWEAGTVSAADACAALGAWTDAAAALVAKGCEVQSAWDGKTNGNPCTQDVPGADCQLLLSQLQGSRDSMNANPGDCYFVGLYANDYKAAQPCNPDSGDFPAPDMSQCGGSGDQAQCQRLRAALDAAANDLFTVNDEASCRSYYAVYEAAYNAYKAANCALAGVMAPDGVEQRCASGGGGQPNGGGGGGTTPSGGADCQGKLNELNWNLQTLGQALNSGDKAQACQYAGYAKNQIAEGAAAGCTFTTELDLDSIMTQNCGADPCPGLLSQLIAFRDGQWSSEPATYCQQVRTYNSVAQSYANSCGNPEGWQLLDESTACASPPPVSGWNYWR